MYNNLKVFTSLRKTFCSSLRLLVNLVTVWVAFLGCERKVEPGYLLLTGYDKGTYEIYRIANESALQFVSEFMGQYNETIPLPPGFYLVMADCSYKKVVIKSAMTEKLSTHKVEFIPPALPRQNDIFSIQCARYENSDFRQNFTNRYSLNTFAGPQDALVGMVPFSMDVETNDRSENSKRLSYKLAGIKINSGANITRNFQNSLFFVSPTQGLVSITQPQNFDQWQFLLPGKYYVSLNGSEKMIDLNPGDLVDITPAFLRFSTPPNIDLTKAAKIRGYPDFITLNQNHSINLNELYPVLPGVAMAQVNQSKKLLSLNLKENEISDVRLRSLQVDLGCAPWEWGCLGKREVYLFDGDNNYPFLESQTDYPVLFWGESVSVGLVGSANIRFRLPEKAESHELKVGKVIFNPEWHHKPGQMTDLVRLESSQAPFEGHSLDIVPERSTTMILLAGTYQLGQYISQTHGDGERWRMNRTVKVEAGTTQNISVPFLLSERKFNSLNKGKKQQEIRDDQQKNHSQAPIGPSPKYF
jgi:hypothetical protein